MPKKKPPAKACKLGADIDRALQRLSDMPLGGAEEQDAKGKVVRLVQREGDGAPPILFYVTDKGMKLELRFDMDEPWFTQAQMAAMFGVSVPTVNEHIQKYLADGEIDNSTIRKFRIVRQEGDREVQREIDHYGLDVGFYVGYRVNSRQGALFRRWATDILVRFAKYGYAMDVERLKAPSVPSIVDELKEIIRELRASTQNDTNGPKH